MKFPMTCYVKEYHTPDQWFWKLIATIHDNEGLGFFERLLDGATIEHKFESLPVPCAPPNQGILR